jgi:hypothetical protein
MREGFYPASWQWLFVCSGRARRVANNYFTVLACGDDWADELMAGKCCEHPELIANVKSRRVGAVAGSIRQPVVGGHDQTTRRGWARPGNDVEGADRHGQRVQ